MARYGEPVISSLQRNRRLTIFVLEAGDEIKAVTGENCHYDGTQVVGKIEIETVNGIKYGPFGHSGNPDQPNPGLIFSSFNTPLHSLRLAADRRFGKFLGPIQS